MSSAPPARLRLQRRLHYACRCLPLPERAKKGQRSCGVAVEFVASIKSPPSRDVATSSFAPYTRGRFVERRARARFFPRPIPLPCFIMCINPSPAIEREPTMPKGNNHGLKAFRKEERKVELNPHTRFPLIPSPRP